MGRGREVAGHPDAARAGGFVRTQKRRMSHEMPITRMVQQCKDVASTRKRIKQLSYLTSAMVERKTKGAEII